MQTYIYSMPSSINEPEQWSEESWKVFTFLPESISNSILKLYFYMTINI